MYTTSFQLPTRLGTRRNQDPEALIRRILNDCTERYPIDHYHVRGLGDRVNVTLFVIAGDDTEAQLIGRLVSIDVTIRMNPDY